MDTVTLALIAIGIATNLTCFLFGMIAGRNSALKTVRTYKVPDTVQDMSNISTSPRGNVN